MQFEVSRFRHKQSLLYISLMHYDICSEKMSKDLDYNLLYVHLLNLNAVLIFEKELISTL